MIGDSWASLARGPIAADLGMLKTADMDGRVLVELRLKNRFALGFKIGIQSTEWIMQSLMGPHSLYLSYKHLLL